MNQESLKLLASKIEEFYASYRQGTNYDILYLPPRQTSSTDSTIKEINAIVARLTKLEAGTFKELFPSKPVAASQLITSRKVGQLKQVKTDSQPSTEDPAVIWVIYGRNEEIQTAMFEFLRSLELKPREWNEAVIEAVKDTGNASPSIPQILTTAFSKGRAVVALMTPDDEVRLKESLRKSDDPPHESQLTGQARPNVIFETGMAMARYPDRTILVQLGALRPFTDIAGLHIIRLDNSTEKRQELADRLRAIKCPVNTKGTDWLNAGDFNYQEPTTHNEEAEIEADTSSKQISALPTTEDEFLKLVKVLKSKSLAHRKFGFANNTAASKDYFYIFTEGLRNLLAVGFFYPSDEFGRKLFHEVCPFLLTHGLVQRRRPTAASGACYLITDKGNEFLRYIDYISASESSPNE